MTWNRLMNSTQEILLSELVQARSYIERLFHALSELSDGHNHPKVRDAISELTDQLELKVRKNILKSTSNENILIHRSGLSSGKGNFKILMNFIESFIALGIEKKELVITVSQLINLTYEHAQHIHQLTQNIAGLDVQPPRKGLIREIDKSVDETPAIVEVEEKKFGPFTLLEGGLKEEELIDEDENAVAAPKLYQLDIEEVFNLISDNNVSLLGLETKREEKYEKFLNEGHKFAYKREHDEALEAFEKARSFKETAEIVTLVGWINSLQGDNEKAKNACLKAISLDPDYGPPYNDLGSILLNEGQIEESLKWFELAKSAPKYQNREYPFINAGRAYMMVHKYEMAMEQFNKALSICPDNEDLKITIEKLQNSLKKKEPLPKAPEVTDFKINFEDTDFSPLEDH